MNPPSLAHLAGLTAIVTGAAQGIGRCMAQQLAAAGANVVIADRDAAAAEQLCAELSAQGRQALAVATDVSQAEDCQRMVQAAAERFGRVDLMFCNAGVMQVKPFMDITAEDWDPILAVNVKGVFLSLQAAARQMLRQAPLGPGRPKGKIITMASIAGRYGGGPMAALIPHYRASKAAVISLTQSAACALAPDITVNAMCPGLVDSEMWKRMDQSLAQIEQNPTGSAFARRVHSVPLGRAQTPDDVAGLALFLASPAADYMTGQSINIDGGLLMN